jgi:hypothetical protein
MEANGGQKLKQLVGQNGTDYLATEETCWATMIQVVWTVA